jgi:hypothetical protein
VAVAVFLTMRLGFGFGVLFFVLAALFLTPWGWVFLMLLLSLHR